MWELRVNSLTPIELKSYKTCKSNIKFKQLNTDKCTVMKKIQIRIKTRRKFIKS